MSMGYYMQGGEGSEEAAGYIIGKIFDFFFDVFEKLFGVHFSGGERFLIILAIIAIVIYLFHRLSKS